MGICARISPNGPPFIIHTALINMIQFISHRADAINDYQPLDSPNKKIKMSVSIIRITRRASAGLSADDVLADAATLQR